MRDDDQHTEDQYHDHMDRLARIRRQWASGEIGYEQKRRLIAAENAAYYGKEFRSPANGERITQLPRRHDEIAGILADTAGVPVEAARFALDTRRRSNYEAANVPSAEEARTIRENGERSYQQILAAARAS